jgi:hypothetical protein
VSKDIKEQETYPSLKTVDYQYTLIHYFNVILLIVRVLNYPYNNKEYCKYALAQIYASEDQQNFQARAPQWLHIKLLPEQFDSANEPYAYHKLY